MADSSQKFIARNRAPRVQIEYDVELYGSEKKVQLPFVMGVMSDLAGKSTVAQPDVEDRKFLEIDVDNFDERMKAMAPRAAFNVPNTLTGEGNLSVDLTFEKMSDFSPAAIASKVDVLRPLLVARTQLSNLMAYMDGKAGAEALIEKILADPALLTAISAFEAKGDDSEAVLESLRTTETEDPEEGDAAGVLDALRTAAPADPGEEDTSADVLAGLAEAAPTEVEAEDESAGVLGDLAQAAPEPDAEADPGSEVLSNLAKAAPEDAVEQDTGADVLAELADAAPAEVETTDESAGVLGDLAQVAPEDAEEEDTGADVLAGLADAAPAEAETVDESAAVLGELAQAAPEPDAEADPGSDVLSDLAEAAPEDAEEEDVGADVLAGLTDAAPAEVETADESAGVLGDLAQVPDQEEEEDASADILTDLAETAPEEIEEDDASTEVLSELADFEPAVPEAEDQSAAVLDDLMQAAAEPEEVDDVSADVLADLAQTEPTPDVEDESGLEILDDLASGAPDEEPQSDSVAGVLEDMAREVPAEEPEDNSVEDLLGDLASDTPVDDVEEEQVDDLLDDLSAAAPGDAPEDGSVDDLLDDLALDAPAEGAEADTVDDLLGDLAAETPEDQPEDDTVDATLSDLSVDAPVEAADDGAVDDLLGDLAAETPVDYVAAEPLDDLLDDLAATVPSDAPEDGSVDDLLGDLALDAPAEGVEADTVDDLLGDLAEETPSEKPEDVSVDDLLGDLALDSPAEEPEESSVDHLDALLGDLSTSEASSDPIEPEAPPDENQDVADENAPPQTVAGLVDDLDDLQADPDDAQVDQPDELDQLLDGLDGAEGGDDAELEDLLGDLTEPGGDVSAEAEQPDDAGIDDLLADLEEEPEEDDLDALLADLEEDEEDEEDTGLSGLDDLMADLDEQADPDDELDALFADLDADADEPVEDAADDDLDALLAGLDEEEDSAAAEDNLDAMLSGLEDEAVEPTESVASGADTGASEGTAILTGDVEFAFGQMGAERPDAQKLKRQRFRIAIFGDFSGRSGRGELEIGDGLASRAPILLDPDTVEDVIKTFSTTLVLPVGKDGAGIEVELKELDDLHPDELYEKVELFAGLSGLKGQLGAGSTAANAATQLRAWGEEFGQKVAPPRKSSGGNTVRADLKLSEFQKLIGDTSGALAEASPLDDMLARIVGPHIQAIPDDDTVAMKEAVDVALSDAMRLILHHPEFQSVESQWRSLDLIARSVETDDTLDVVLYDVSAEEITADLASADDLASSGLVRLLTEEPLDEENGRGGYSALIGLYTFEETPPHAELLGRVARVAAHVDAPFFSAITPVYLDVAKEDRHPLVAEAWDTLRSMAEAGHLGLASPRFLLRRPYGETSEPIYEFDFEEFTMSEGLSGMLWANPVVLVTILLAKSFRQNGKPMGLGQIMSLGEMPFHYVADRYGDQVALPCTERNITMSKLEHSVQRGIMPVLSVKGRDEIRLGSFNSVAGREILGPWSGEAPPQPSPPDPKTDGAEKEELPADAGDEDDLDALLASFDDDSSDDGSGDEDIDAELAALLEDL